MAARVTSALRGRALWLFGLPLLLLALALAASTAPGSAAGGDAFGDSVSVDGEVDGDPADSLGPDDDAIVQIGTEAGGGSVTVSFDDNVAFNGPGADVRVHTLDAIAPATATIELSADGVTFVSAGDFTDDAGDLEIDLGPLGLDFAVAVRVTHVSGELPGFDLDAVEALNQINLDDLTLIMLPASGSNLAGDDHEVTATVEFSASPVEGVLVSFRVTSGPNTGDADSTATDAAGEADFSYTGDGGAGSDTITAWLDLDGDSAVDAEEPQAVATKEWLALGSLGVTATPESDSNPEGTTHTVVATLSPAFAGVNVSFRVVSGPNAGDAATVATSAAGTASFTYTGDGGAGIDAISAWIDVDGGEDIDGGEPQDTVTKTWTAVTVTTLALAPSADTNPVGTSHTLTATVTPASSGVVVRFEVTSGPNAGTSDVDTTDAAGQATFAYAGASAGTDVIVAWIDDDGDAVRDAGEPQALAVKSWTADGVTSIVLSPAADSNPIGSTHTVTATVSPTTAGALVRFRVASGPNAGLSGSDTTDAASQATFAYSSALTGIDVIEAWVDTTSNGIRDADEPLAAALKMWVTSGAVTGLSLAPAADTNFVNSSHTLTATVTPTIAGVLVRFDVLSGPHSASSGSDVTDAAGRATFNYTGTATGTDIVLAWADLDGDGQADSNEPQAIASKEWVSSPSLDDGGVSGEKVTICHVPPGNPGNAHTITIGAPAVAAHLAEHGDTVGPCPTTASSGGGSQGSGVAGAGTHGQSNTTKLAKRLRDECGSEIAGLPHSLGALKKVLASSGLDPTTIKALLDAENCAQLSTDLSSS